MTLEPIPLDEHRARQLTERIRDAAEELWALLLEAHEGRAWAALGYPSWEAYVRAEFDMSRSHSYRMLDQARVIRELESVSGTSRIRDISMESAQDLKPHLEIVKDAIRQAVEDVPADRVAEVVAEVVEQERARIIQQRQDRQEIEALNAEHDPGPEFDWDRDAELIRQRGAIRRVAEELASFPEPRQFVAEHPKLSEATLAAIHSARAWLDGFVNAWEAR